MTSQWYNVGPPVKSWFINPTNTIVISTINHSYWSYLHQLSYRTGAPHCMPSKIPHDMPPVTTGSRPRLDPAKFPPALCDFVAQCLRRDDTKSLGGFLETYILYIYILYLLKTCFDGDFMGILCDLMGLWCVEDFHGDFVIQDMLESEYGVWVPNLLPCS